mmetsp:Transcript_36816/g.95326  ORF Transcript_36816/g.95326 Transcript_36816/m.95326 type:complete len:82 (+) Transcript_36816:2388-2633(+)
MCFLFLFFHTCGFSRNVLFSLDWVVFFPLFCKFLFSPFLLCPGMDGMMHKPFTKKNFLKVLQALPPPGTIEGRPEGFRTFN